MRQFLISQDSIYLFHALGVSLPGPSLKVRCFREGKSVSLILQLKHLSLALWLAAFQNPESSFISRRGCVVIDLHVALLDPSLVVYSFLTSIITTQSAFRTGILHPQTLG